MTDRLSSLLIKPLGGHSMGTYTPRTWFRWLQDQSRRAKWSLFLGFARPSAAALVLDIGAGPGTFLEAYWPHKQGIVAVDVNEAKLGRLRDAYPGVAAVVGDAGRLPFRAGVFHVAFCNAVLEHLGTDERRDAAGEMRRVAQRFVAFVPNRHFPLEPHSKTAFLHWLPKRFFRAALRALGKARLIRMDPGFEYDVLGRRELRRLFPDACVHTICWGAHIAAYGEGDSHVSQPSRGRVL